MFMRIAPVAAASAIVLAGVAAAATNPPQQSGRLTIAAAISDAARPADDTVRDAGRKPAEKLAFLGVKRGDKIADYAAGSGYFTRLLLLVAGRRGHVYSSCLHPFSASTTSFRVLRLSRRTRLRIPTYRSPPRLRPTPPDTLRGSTSSGSHTTIATSKTTSWGQ